MNDLEIFLACLTCAVSGYFVGRASMLSTIVKAVAEEAVKELDPEKQELMLTFEHHNDTYYAYVDGNFAGQGANFVDLFTSMKSNKQFDNMNFKITQKALTDLNLSDELKKEMFDAVVKVYGTEK